MKFAVSINTTTLKPGLFDEPDKPVVISGPLTERLLDPAIETTVMNLQDAAHIGQSRGGMTTKTHATVDAVGNPVRLLLTTGQASEYGQANALIEGFKAGYIAADRGCDSNDFVETIERSGATAVIPSRRNRRNRRPYDKGIYKARNLVERFFQKIKNFRRIATRYERLSRNYMAMLQLVATVIWLK